MSIRFKVILPYLILTLLVAVIGAYVVTQLVTDSLTERLNNQLLEAGRAVSDRFARLELQHIDDARVIAFTRGVAEALRDADRPVLDALVTPTAAGQNIEDLILVDIQGQEMLHVQRQADGEFLIITKPGQKTALEFIQPLLESHNPDETPSRAINKDPENNHLYYFTALPFISGDEMIGAVIVGTSLDTITPNLKTTSFADVIIYGGDGMAIASTLKSQGEQEPIFLNALSIPEETYHQVVTADGIVYGANLSIDERQYSLARGKLQVNNDLIGIYAVALSTEYVVQTAALNRNLYVVIFSLAMVVVVMLGLVITRRSIINPLSSLVKTSEAIARGDLARRTDIRSKDEFGVLAVTFDNMIKNLQMRTEALERSNRILEQMDRTRSNFVTGTVHELR